LKEIFVIGTKDLKNSVPGRYCVEINGCEKSSCYNHSTTPAICTDVLWDSLSFQDDPYMVNILLIALLIW